MGYEQWWKALEALIAEFRKKEIEVPTEAMTYLRSAKTMIKVYNADPTRLETVPTIENYLVYVESSLMNIAQEEFGEAFTERWIKKLQRSRKEEEPKVETTSSRLIPGVPKGTHWIRVLPSDDVLKENVVKLAGECGLSHKTQKDGYILVYGGKEKVKDFVKKMAEKSRRSRKT